MRSTHAQYDDRVFDWDNPPDGGHPGQAFNCRCQAGPFIPQASNGSSKSWDGFAFRYGDVDRDQMRRNAEAEMLALRPAIEALANIPRKTADQVAEQRALAEAFMAAAYRYELASREAGALGRSGLLFGPEAERARLIADAEANRKGANNIARGMLASPFLEGIHPSEVLRELRQNAPETTRNYLNSQILIAGVRYLPVGLTDEEERLKVLRDIGRGFVAAARAVERERGQSGAFDPMQWNALEADMLRTAQQGTTAGDSRAIADGMKIEVGRLFVSETLSMLTGGLLGAVGAAARAPIRITADILDDGGRFLGQSSGGPNARSFQKWATTPGNVVEIMQGGQIRYTTTIADPASSLNGRTVSVSYTDGVPDFSQLGIARVDIPNPVGRGAGINSKADMQAASRALWADIEAGRVGRELFTQKQLDQILAGNYKISGLTWHHNGVSLNRDGTGPMLLLDERAHKLFGHIGWASTINP